VNVRFQVGDRVIERVGAGSVPTVIEAIDGDRVRTRTGGWFDALTGKGLGEGPYRAIHSAEYAGTEVRQ